jgi:hypothetical protein
MYFEIFTRDGGKEEKLKRLLKTECPRNTQT